MKIMTWFWQQKPNRAGYDAEKVNRWADGISRHLRLPHTLACVTDTPAGIDASIEIIPLPKDFESLKVPTWSEASGLPQCYRRLALFAPDAADRFGDDDLVSSDMDALFFALLDPLFAERVDFRMFAGTSRLRPYNGSLVRIRAGARRQVWDQFTANPMEVAKKARTMYIGSDQAVISMILGRGERTWGERDGVHHYSPKFQRTNMSPSGRPSVPPNMRVLFFPGHVKPWDAAAHRHPVIAAEWHGRRKPQQEPPKPRLRAYRDPKGWGSSFARAAQARGISCPMFNRARFVPSGLAFVRLDQQGAQREISRRLVADLNRRGIKTLPTAREALWYDDKAAQMEALEQWMPATEFFRSQVAAELWLDTGARFPFVSKSIDGAGSRGVRLIHDRAEARAELRRAFTSPGIPSVYDRWQLGYVYWQEFVPGQACDYRICVVGSYVYGLVRNVRPGDFRASGSGSFRNLTMADDRERAAAQLGVEIANAIGTDWMAFDIVFAQDGRPLVLEMSSAWTMKAYETAPCFSRGQLAPTSRTGADSFAIAVEIMERMACAQAA
jgi:glutathione synthase/RimK-type ligase-like ATP-grasp enzyme